MTDDTLHNHFMCGRYHMCVTMLENLHISLFKPSSIQANSNLSVCRLLKLLSEQWSDCEELLASSLQSLQTCLTQMQSFPPSLSNMKIELTVLYNWLYLKLIISLKSSKKKLFSSLYECGSSYLKSLHRVFACVKHPLSSGVFEEEAVIQHLVELTKYSELLKVYRVTSPLCFAGCALSSLMLFGGKLKKCLSCLESLVLFCDKSSGSMQGHEKEISVSPTGFLLSLSDEDVCSSAPGISARDLVYTLQGLCNYRLAHWSDSRDSLSWVQTVSFQPHVKYITALCSFHENNPKQSLSCLEGMTGNDVTPRIRARYLHLNAQCYDKMGLHLCAIQMWREALQIDFSYMMPLFHIAQMYQKLGQEDAELEALNLLVTTLEDTVSNTSSSLSDHVTVTSVWTSDIFQHVCPELTITLSQALYSLAHRCFQLHRYEDGAPRFLDLLAVLCDTEHLQTQEESASAVQLPDICVIYQETADCLLQAGQYNDCITVCNKALEAVCLNTSASSSEADDLSFLLNHDDSEEVLQTQTSSSRKRPRTISCDLENGQTTDCWQELQHFMTLTLCRVEALIGLHDEDTAIKSLHKAVEAFQECIGHWLGADQVNRIETFQPASKRQKMGEDEVLIRTDESESCDPAHYWKPLMVKACCRLSTLLTNQGKYPDALHFARLAVQIHPDDTQVWMTSCDVLEKQGRVEEAATTWLHHRGMENLSDQQFLARELNRKQLVIRKLSAEVLDSERQTSKQKLEMDVKSLENLLKHRELGFS